MVFKNCKELSNAEISLYKTELENEFNALRDKINAMCDDLDKIEKEYNNAENELSIRKGIF